MPYRTLTNYLGESETLSFFDLAESEQSDFTGQEESVFIRDAYGKAYNLSDFMIPANLAWYDGYMSSGIDGIYLIKICNNDIIKIFFQYIIYVSEKMVKVKERI